MDKHHPGATDCSELTGLLRVDGATKVVAFLALSVNFLQLVSGWTGKARGAVEW